jgi:sterol desaturase/sphingolipid hydroxylase (fatty acid hydroxylase superfamily)
MLVRPAAIATLSWTTQKPFGLVHLLALPSTLQFIAAFLLMDLTFYWWHIANHRIGFLWRFHNVHHIDPDLDVSTGFRFHFGESGDVRGFSCYAGVAHRDLDAGICRLRTGF